MLVERSPSEPSGLVPTKVNRRSSIYRVSQFTDLIHWEPKFQFCPAELIAHKKSTLFGVLKMRSAAKLVQGKVLPHLHCA